MQDGDDQGRVPAPGPADERRPGRGGPADLAAEIARERVQHAVLGPQVFPAGVMAGPVRPELEAELPQRLVVHESGHGQRLPGEQRLVVGRHVLARRVQAVRPHGDRVVGLQVVRLGVDHRHALGVGPGRLGQRDRRVVGGDHQERLEQGGDLVAVALDQPHLARYLVRGPARGDHGRVRVEHRHQGDGGQDLQRAGGRGTGRVGPWPPVPGRFRRRRRRRPRPSPSAAAARRGPDS